MNKITEFLDGKKSYLTALAAIAYGVYMGLAGGMEWVDVINYVLGGTALASVKSAMSKVGIWKARYFALLKARNHLASKMIDDLWPLT